MLTDRSSSCPEEGGLHQTPPEDQAPPGSGTPLGPGTPQDQALPRPGSPLGPGTPLGPGPPDQAPPRTGHREQNHRRLWKYNFAPTSLRAVTKLSRPTLIVNSFKLHCKMYHAPSDLKSYCNKREIAYTSHYVLSE